MKIDLAEACLSIIATTAIFAAIMPDNETRVLAFNIVGAALGGLVGVETGGAAATLTKVQKRWRWVTNFSAGIFIGPLLTDYAIEQWFPKSPQAYVALASGGLSGFAAVAVLCVGGPLLLKWIRTKNQPVKIP